MAEVYVDKHYLAYLIQDGVVIGLTVECRNRQALHSVIYTFTGTNALGELTYDLTNEVENLVDYPMEYPHFDFAEEILEEEFEFIKITGLLPKEPDWRV